MNVNRRPSWVVYILRCGDGTLYTGVTNDFARRMKMHREGRGAKYTRGRGPLRVRYLEKVRGRSAALKREAVIKKLTRVGKLGLGAHRTVRSADSS